MRVACNLHNLTDLRYAESYIVISSLSIIKVFIPICVNMSPALHQASFWRSEADDTSAEPKEPTPFAGRIGANQEFSLDRNNCRDIALLQRHPDAAPWVPWKDSLSLKQLFELELWKAAAVEGLGMLSRQKLADEGY